ncbi:hypothetical protein GBA52_013697 [Prunus armeniaca]|nr:hypothetical protein GBA52_013697 [Prunus armeniaca]
MSKRAHTTELGSIACEELGELGAGKEGWLVDNPSLLCALDTHSLALANRSVIVVLGWAEPDSTRLKIRPELSPISAEFVTAIEWLVFDEIRVVVAGTSSGSLLFFSLAGDLIHKQMVYPARIIRLRVRGTKRDLSHETSSEEVCVVMPGIVARFDGSDIQTRSQFWDPNPRKRSSDDFGRSYGKLPYQLWSVSKYGTCADAAITGIMPPPLMEIQSNEHYYCGITVGEDAVISAFRLSEDKNRSLVGAILSKVVPATFSTIASLSKMIWRSDQTSPRKSDEKPQPFARASPLTCLKDFPRKGEKLTLSPSGTDIGMLVAYSWRCWQKKILQLPGSSYYEPTKSDYCLCLAIHAPRKGIVEIWQMRTGPRLRSFQCAKGSKLLQPTYRFGSSIASTYVPLEVFLLNGDSGQISVLNRTLN